ncbi:hypothetical protein [Fluviispira vulneris]|uniref:hypothetical protein n=1 Tax=Fluviispira vulneris TaxID=2763012 RepID=UPI00164907B2|nr:hypothetical protein [Fluviispira vulneris]
MTKLYELISSSVKSLNEFINTPVTLSFTDEKEFYLPFDGEIFVTAYRTGKIPKLDLKLGQTVIEGIDLYMVDNQLFDIYYNKTQSASYLPDFRKFSIKKGDKISVNSEQDPWGIMTSDKKINLPYLIFNDNINKKERFSFSDLNNIGITNMCLYFNNKHMGFHYANGSINDAVCKYKNKNGQFPGDGGKPGNARIKYIRMEKVEESVWGFTVTKCRHHLDIMHIDNPGDPYPNGSVDIEIIPDEKNKINFDTEIRNLLEGFINEIN